MSISAIHGSSQTISETRTSSGLQRLDVDRGRAAEFAQRLGHARALDHAAREEAVQRRELERGVAHHLDPRAARCRTRSPARTAGRGRRRRRALARSGRACIACSVTPSMRAFGCARRTAATISAYCARTSAALRTFSTTPPTSLLCVTSAELTFIATGKPICSAITIASVRRARDHGARHRHVEGAQQRLRLHLGEHLAPLGKRALDQHARAVEVGRLAGPTANAASAGAAAGSGGTWPPSRRRRPRSRACGTPAMPASSSARR